MNWYSSFSKERVRELKQKHRSKGLSDEVLDDMLVKLSAVGHSYAQPVENGADVALDPDPDSMSFNLKWCDGNSPDSVNEISVPTGIDYHSRFYHNRVCLLDHGKNGVNLPIGLASDKNGLCTLFIDPVANIGTARIFLFQGEGEHGDLCKSIYSMVSSGLLTAGSYGYIVNEQEELPNGVKVLTRTTLLELTLCTLPCHPDAVATKALSDGYINDGNADVPLSPILANCILNNSDDPICSCLPKSRKARLELLHRAHERELFGLKMLAEQQGYSYTDED